MFKESEHPRDENGQFVEKGQRSLEDLKKAVKDIGENLEDFTKKKMFADALATRLHRKGFTQEEVNLLRESYSEKKKKKVEQFVNFQKQKHDTQMKQRFGNDVDYDDKGRVKFKHFVSNDEIRVVSKNVQYWKNKDTYVMWVDNDKVVYLKAWQVEPIKSWSLQEDAYAVHLNRQYFKPYKTYTSDKFTFEKEDTFDNLVDVAKDQDAHPQQWKMGHYNFVD